jgi:ribosome-binding protein aMBF1 (putative translation factor)
MSESKQEDRVRRRLTPATMTPEQRAAYDRRRAERETPEYQEQLKRDIEEIQREHPPARVASDLLPALQSLRAVREAKGLSLTDMMERTKIDRATISKLETGKIPNPTYQTIRDYASALGKRVVWTVEDDGGEGQ